jgi:hypothetical protein
MSATLSCSDIPEEKIIRKSIVYLQGLGSGQEPTLKEAISTLSEKLKCEPGTKGSKSYEQIKTALKKAMAVFFRHGPDSSQWAEFKAKYKRREKEAKSPKTSREPKSPKAPTFTSRGLGELESLPASQLSSLAEMCRSNQTKAEIQKELNRVGISKIGGQTVSKIRKSDLCETIRIVAPSKVSAPAAQSSHSDIKPEDCDTRSWTIEKLKQYITSQGWPAPPSKATKAKICAYIESMQGKPVQPPVAPSQAAILSGPSVQVPGATSEVPEGYDDCGNSRGKLTKPKIRQWVIEKGWNLEPDFPGFPSDKKDKSTWCSFLAGLISAHPLTLPKESAQVSAPEESQPRKKRAVTTCAQTSDWKTVEEVEQELASCPSGQSCNITTKECAPDKDLVEEQRPSMLLNLKSGKTAHIYAKKAEHLQKLRPILQQLIKRPESAAQPSPSKSCATVSSGDAEDIIDSLSCPAKESCNLDKSQCQKEQPGQIQLSLSGKSVTGSADKISELQKNLETSKIAEIPTLPKTKPKVVFKPGHVVYGEEERKRQAQSSAWISQLIGESKEEPARELPEQTPKEVVHPKSPVRREQKSTIPSPAREVPIPVTEQPSEVSRLVRRLRDIRADAAEPPVRLRIAESRLSKAIGTCVGIPS